jgi:hypothetical protein
VTEEGGFGQNLDVDELGGRLKRDRLEPLAPMQPTGRVEIGDRDREQVSERGVLEPAIPPLRSSDRAAADRVVGLVDRLQKRPQVGIGPRLECRGHEHQRLAHARESPFECTADPLCIDNLDHRLCLPAAGSQELDDALGDRLRSRMIGPAEHDHANPGVRQWIAMQVRLERVNGHAHAWTGPLESDRLGNEPALDSAAISGLEPLGQRAWPTA